MTTQCAAASTTYLATGRPVPTPTIFDPRARRSHERAAGTVAGTVANRTVIALEGRLAGISAVASVAGTTVDLSAHLTRGAHVEGLFDHAKGTIDVTHAVAGLSLPAPASEIDRSQAVTAKRLTGQLDHARAEIRELRHQLDTARKRLVSQTTGEAGRTVQGITDDGLFLDPADQFRFEVELAWARRVPAAQKADYPLRPWTIGDEFIHTMEASQGTCHTKVVGVVVEVIAGIAQSIHSRAVKPLRMGWAQTAGIWSRSDGAVCFRARIQSNSPAARRLHYWRLPGGTIELSSVRTHDDMRP